MKKLTQNQVEERITKCFELRYNNGGQVFGHKEWQEYCNKHYGDKSPNSYTDYWMEASRRYKAFWKEKLDIYLAPAVDKMTELLEDDDPKVVQKAVEQIFKYSGNDVEKIDMNHSGQLKLTWGDTH